MAGKSAKRRQAQSAPQLGQILSLLQKMSVTPPKPKRTRRRRRANGASTSVKPDGIVALSRTEMVSNISLPSGNASSVGHVDLVPDSFAFLKGLFKSFDRIKWLKLQVFYKPAVGTVYGGLVSVGVDWDFASTDVGRASMSGFTPNFTTPAWQDTQSRAMVLPSSRINSTAWYTPTGQDSPWCLKGPGKLHWAVDGTTSKTTTTIGELWISYSVQLMGTNPL